MKTLLCLTLLCVGCATTNMSAHIYNNSTMSDKVVNDTYRSASDLFVETTRCILSKNIILIIKDATLKELNQGNNIFYYGDNGLSVNIRIGDYNPDSHTIRFSIEYPDRQRVLFHEMLHFLIHDVSGPNCMIYDIVKRANIKEEHFVIRQLEEIYFVQTNRSDISDNWIYEVLKYL